LIDAELIDPYTIRFLTKERYFQNESVLGGIPLLPRHYYDPDNLLRRVTVKALAKILLHYRRKRSGLATS
jgi:hypothetical protein